MNRASQGLGVITALFLACLNGCGSLDDAGLTGSATGINLVLQNPDETASGTAKAVEGTAADYAVAKAAATLDVTTCNVSCTDGTTTASKTVSFASSASQVEVALDCPAGANVTITADCADSSKTSNSVQYGFTCSTTTSVAGGDSITCDGLFLNQATRSTGDCRYVKIAQNSTQLTVGCGFASSLTDAQKTTAQCNVEYSAASSGSSPATVDTSSDGFQASKVNPYVRIVGGLLAPSCFQYTTGDAKELRGTGSWTTDSDGNTSADCAFGVRQWRQFDDDRKFRYAASCTRDGGTWVAIPSSGVAQGKTSSASDSDVASLVAAGTSCSSANACSSGWCVGSSFCASLSASPSAAVTNQAGDGAVGSDNGNATTASFDTPIGCCLSPDGNSLYCTDAGNHTVRKIDFSLASTNANFVTTFAGQAGSTGDTNDTCTASLFNGPRYCAVNADHTAIFVTELFNDTIRKITLSGGTCSTVSLFAGTSGSAGFTNATGSGASFNNPLGIAIDSDGTLYAADRANNAIRKITSGAVVTTLAGGCSGATDGTGTAACFDGPNDVTLDSTGTFLYVADNNNKTIRKINVATQAVTTLATMSAPTNVTIDPTDTKIYVSDGNAIRTVTIASGTISLVAGNITTAGSDNGSGGDARFSSPNKVVITPVGTACYVADGGNNLIRLVQ